METMTEGFIDTLMCGVTAGLIALNPGPVVPEGVYDGRITDGDHVAGVTTILEVETHIYGDAAFAEVTGRYIIKDPQYGTHTGPLELWRDLGPDEYCFVWHDPPLSDAAHLVFAPDASSFTGKWYIDGEVGGVWTGTRR